MQRVPPCQARGTCPRCFQPRVVALQPPDPGPLRHEVLPVGSAQGLQVLVLGPGATARPGGAGGCAEPRPCACTRKV